MRPYWHVVAMVLWFCCVMAGWYALTRHSTAAGLPADAPSESQASPEGHLLVFAHPKCPCTPATLRSLARLLPNAATSPKVTVFVMVPASADQAVWARDAVTQISRVLPHSTILADPGGETAQRYGVRTSGQILYYTSAGVLAFEGGITPGRGHEGRSTTQHRLLDALATNTPADPPSPVFGCALHNRSVKL